MIKKIGKAITDHKEDSVEPLIVAWNKRKIVNKYPQIHSNNLTGLHLGLVVLKISKEEFNCPWLTANKIAALLTEVFSVPTTTELGITRAFAKAGGSDKSRNPIILRKTTDSIFYKLSQPGELVVDSILGKGLLQVLYLHPNSHLDAREGLQNFVRKLKGKELVVSDPYYGVDSFKILEMIIREKKKIKFISHRTDENINKIKAEIGYLHRNYRGMIDVRIYPKNELHDRYIIADDAFVIVGNGIKDLGNKESLVLVIDDRIGKDTRKQLEKAFWKRWQDPSCKPL